MKLCKAEQKVIDICNQNNNLITFHDCHKNKITSRTIKNMVRKGLLFQLEKGVYSNNENEILDLYWYIQYKNKKVIFDGIAACGLYGLTTEMNYMWDVAIPFGYKLENHNNLGIIFNKNYESLKTINVGLEKIKADNGSLVKVYCPERVIINIIRKGKKSEFSNDLIIRYNNKFKNINKLLKIAKVFKITKEEIESWGICLNE